MRFLERLSPFSLAVFLAIPLSLCVADRATAGDCDGVQPVSGTDITLERVGPRFSRPIDVQAVPGDTERLFVVEQGGRIRILDLSDDSFRGTFVNLAGNITCCGERGLLGLAFHPDYSENGFFYVNYSRRGDGDTVVSRFEVSADDPDLADPASEVILLMIDQPFGNHNGGQLLFGPNDGYLYISTGDGGSGGDPGNRAQNPLSLLGKLLRIDVDSTTGNLNYGIPESNPFVSMPKNTVRGEIWALGLRNPWRMAFDSENGDLYIGDVGQGAWEEIDFQPGTSKGGENYQWRRLEGNHNFNLGTSLTIGTSTSPVLEYNHSQGSCSVTGGHLYRGCRLPDLHGTYFFAEYCSDWIRSARINATGDALVEIQDRTGELNAGIRSKSPNRVRDISAFGADAHGELYISDLSGYVYRIIPDISNNPPTALIATDPDPATVTLRAGSAEVTLDGTSSDDGDGGAQGLSYLWEKISGPDGDAIATPEAASTTVAFTQHGEYLYRLSVNDSLDIDQAQISVSVELPFFRGDSNTDSKVDLSDGIATLNYLFLGSDEPDCLDAADTDDNGTVELTDAVFTFNYLFLGGGDPPAPGPMVCGPDPTQDDLDCQWSILMNCE